MDNLSNVSVDAVVSSDVVDSVSLDEALGTAVTDALVNDDVVVEAAVETPPAKVRKPRKASAPRILAVGRKGRRSDMPLVDYVVRAMGSESLHHSVIAERVAGFGYVSNNPAKLAGTVLAMMYQKSYNKFFEAAEVKGTRKLTELGLQRFNELAAHLTEQEATVEPTAEVVESV